MTAPPPVMPRPDRARAHATAAPCVLAVALPREWFALRFHAFVACLHDVAPCEEVPRG